MKKVLLVVVLLIFATTVESYAQGCIVTQGGGGSCSLNSMEQITDWELNVNLRGFRSHRHFVGSVEQKEREENKTQVVNKVLGWDYILAKKIKNHWTVMVNIPITYNYRSSKYEHYGNISTSPLARRSTESFGIGDIRFAAYYSLANQRVHQKGNLRIGLGIKLPTGDYNYTDYFYRQTRIGADSAVLGPVDQSIQLGDGGTGLTFEIRGYESISSKLVGYVEGFYLVNPREQNGVSTARGGVSSATAIKYSTSTMSVADIYTARAGFNYHSKKLVAGLGCRIDGVPSSDLIGGDRGFRRPGYTLALEPTISWLTKGKAFYISAPLSLVRNRTQSYSDKLRTIDTGTRVQGDAAFADFVINAGINIRF